MRIKLLLSAFLAGLLVLPATSWAEVFFGEDLNSSSSTPLPEASRVNSSAAQASFLSNLYGVGTETFESYTNGQTGPIGINFPGAGTATLSGDGFINSVPAGSASAGRYATSGTQFWESRGAFNIDFTAPIAAFGFYGVDIGDFGGQITLTTMGGTTTTYTVDNTVGASGSTDGSVLFWGIIDTTNLFTSISFGNTSGRNDAFAFDDMIIGSVEQVCGQRGNPPCNVPESASIALMGLGLIGLVAVRRRKFS